MTRDEKLVFSCQVAGHLAQDLGPRWHPADLAAPPSSPPTPTFSAHRQTLLWAKALQKAAQDLHVLKKSLLLGDNLLDWSHFGGLKDGILAMNNQSETVDLADHFPDNLLTVRPPTLHKMQITPPREIEIKYQSMRSLHQNPLVGSVIT